VGTAVNTNGTISGAGKIVGTAVAASSTAKTTGPSGGAAQPHKPAINSKNVIHNVFLLKISLIDT
jgi:hypothetical protein